MFWLMLTPSSFVDIQNQSNERTNTGTETIKNISTTSSPRHATSRRGNRPATSNVRTTITSATKRTRNKAVVEAERGSGTNLTTEACNVRGLFRYPSSAFVSSDASLSCLTRPAKIIVEEALLRTMEKAKQMKNIFKIKRKRKSLWYGIILEVTEWHVCFLTQYCLLYQNWQHIGKLILNKIAREKTEKKARTLPFWKKEKKKIIFDPEPYSNTYLQTVPVPHRACSVGNVRTNDWWTRMWQFTRTKSSPSFQSMFLLWMDKIKYCNRNKNTKKKNNPSCLTVHRQ